MICFYKYSTATISYTISLFQTVVVLFVRTMERWISILVPVHVTRIFTISLYHTVAVSRATFLCTVFNLISPYHIFQSATPFSGYSIINGEARAPKRVRTPKRGYWKKLKFSPIASLFISERVLKKRICSLWEQILSFKSSFF